jgi:periplasmic protein TonB
MTLRIAQLAACIFAACAMPAAAPAAAQQGAGTPRAAPSGCPAPTETLYKPPLPTPGFVPRPPAGATIIEPRRLLGATPGYPSASTRCREQGKVTITYCVSAEGQVENVQVIISSGFARLDNAILAWATRDRHTAGTVNGRPRLYCGLHEEHEFEIELAVDGGPAL